MPSFPVVLTIEAVAERLLTTPGKVLAELEAGRLEGFRVGDEWRITELALLKFMGLSHPDTNERSPVMTTTVMEAVAAASPSTSGPSWTMPSGSRVKSFAYQWPDNKPPAKYDEVYVTHLQIGFRDHKLCVAMGTFDSFGDKQRRRGVVFRGCPQPESARRVCR